MVTERATNGISLAGLLVVAVLAAAETGCAKRSYIGEPWMGGSGEQVKEKWESPRTPQQLEQLRNRMMTSQTDR